MSRFDEDPNEQANVSGADFALMCEELRAQAARIAELESGLPLRVAHGAQAVTSEKYKFRLAQLEQQIEELEKDAARWKWLRANWFEFGLHSRNTKIGQYLHGVGNAGDIETLDAAIDAAISLQEGTTK
jgi:beta-glucosidase-like glycosyl hydrolase